MIYLGQLQQKAANTIKGILKVTELWNTYVCVHIECRGKNVPNYIITFTAVIFTDTEQY